MLRIRLSRIGKRKQPYYRLVVTDQRNPRGGAHLEIVGHYNPLQDPAALNLKEDRVIHWLQNGAQPSDTAAKLLTRAGVMERAGRAPVVYEGKEVPRAEKPKKDEAAAAAPAATAVAEAPAPAAEPEAEAPVAEPEAEAPAAEPEAEAPAAEPEAEAPAAEAEAEPAAKAPAAEETTAEEAPAEEQKPEE